MQQGTDVETIEHLDFDADMPCDCTIATGEPAEWVGRCWTCGALIWACTPHLQLIELQVLRLRGNAACMGCGRSGATLADILHVIPLRSM